MVERKAFLANPKRQYHVSQWGEHDCSAHHEKNGDYNEYLSLSYFPGWTLIIRKIVERKAFLINPKRQYRVSQYGEHDCSAHNEKKGDYNEYPSLPHFTNQL